MGGLFYFSVFRVPNNKGPPPWQVWRREPATHIWLGINHLLPFTKQNIHQYLPLPPQKERNNQNSLMMMMMMSRIDARSEMPAGRAKDNTKATLHDSRQDDGCSSGSIK